ncbi:MAG: hypothetical protein ABJF10_16180 [Chthoniobacter sp.]|uniref:hypothetical protein n=1 Tax=Chthoniobacter sp. TaxID=2510640 RepID=UPI0032AC88C0
MKKLLSIVALTALVIGLPSGSFAAEKKAKPAATPAATPAPVATPAPIKPIPLYAEVTTIDAAGKSFTHKNKDGKEVKFTLTATTEVKNGKADAKFEDIKVGDWVSGLRLKKSDTEYEVVKITKFGPKTEKKPDAAGKPAAATPAAPGKPTEKKAN